MRKMQKFSSKTALRIGRCPSSVIQSVNRRKSPCRHCTVEARAETTPRSTRLCALNTHPRWRWHRCTITQYIASARRNLRRSNSRLSDYRAILSPEGRGASEQNVQTIPFPTERLTLEETPVVLLFGKKREGVDETSSLKSCYFPANLKGALSTEALDKGSPCDEANLQHFLLIICSMYSLFKLDIVDKGSRDSATASAGADAQSQARRL